MSLNMSGRNYSATRRAVPHQTGHSPAQRPRWTTWVCTTWGHAWGHSYSRPLAS